jgi:hypothetical protein
VSSQIVRRLSGLVCGLACVTAFACGPELTDPADSNVTGVWTSADTVGGIYNVRLDLAQDESSGVTGRWSGQADSVNGQCPADTGCAPTNDVTGSNTVLQLHLEILGAGTFTGQVVTADAFRGNLARSGSNFSIRFTRQP